MKHEVRELVSATLLAIAYTAVILVVGKLYVESRSTDPSAISVKQRALVPQSFHGLPSTPSAAWGGPLVQRYFGRRPAEQPR
jgi:hypothetical protein